MNSVGTITKIASQSPEKVLRETKGKELCFQCVMNRVECRRNDGQNHRCNFTFFLDSAGRIDIGLKCSSPVGKSTLGIELILAKHHTGIQLT